jgi:hypothetical protein
MGIEQIGHALAVLCRQCLLSGQQEHMLGGQTLYFWANRLQRSEKLLGFEGTEGGAADKSADLKGHGLAL